MSPVEQFDSGAGPKAMSHYKDYGFIRLGASHMHVHFMPPVLALAGDLKPGTRVLDVGCGNGFTCGIFLERCCQVVGINLAGQRIEIARKTFPGGALKCYRPTTNSWKTSASHHLTSW